MKTSEISQQAVVLLSGGMDSATCLAIAREQDCFCYAISFDYGQKNRAELLAAKHIARELGVVEHRVVALPMELFQGSALTDSNKSIADFKDSRLIPTTYVPARNLLFLSMALAFAEARGIARIFIGVNAMDYSGYPDCRPDFIAAFRRAAHLATRAGVEGEGIAIETPLIAWRKCDIIAEGIRLGVDYRKTVTCYRADTIGAACGSCDSCVLRKRGFAEAGIADATVYQEG